MSENRFIHYCVNTDDCLVCKYVQKHYNDEIVGFTGADCLKGHSIYPQTCEDFEIKFYWKIIRKLKRCFGSY